MQKENEMREQRGEPLLEIPKKINKFLDKKWSDLDQKTFYRDLTWVQAEGVKRRRALKMHDET